MSEQAHSATSTTDIAVEIVGVTKVFRQKQRSEKLRDAWRNLMHPQVREIQALRDVSVTMRRGEIVAYAGPNGAGKSTTVKLLSGMLSPTAGSVRAIGMDPVRERRRYVRDIGVVFGQRTELWWDHPVAASFEWKRVVWSIPDQQYHRMLGTVRELLGLDEFFNSLARELSLGQKMRADLGLMLLHEPKILFLDEPTLGLDVLAKRNVLDFIKRVNREQNVTVLVTSHDMSDLEQLASRIVMIDRGRIAFDGDFAGLRREFGTRRRLLIETQETSAPTLTGAQHVRSEAERHEYWFDASRVKVSDLLNQAAAQTRVLDVETHGESIDTVIADIYEKWQEAKAHVM